MLSSNQINVGIGATALYKGMSGKGIDGIGHYTNELIGSLSACYNLKLQPFTFGSFCQQANSPVLHQLPSFKFGSLPSLLFGKSYFGIDKLRTHVDLIHATDHLIPSCKGIPVVATIMDAIPLAHPEWVNNRLSSLKNYALRKSISFADRVITISSFSKQELIEYFRIPEQKISITPLGVDQRWFNLPSPEYLAAVRGRYNLPENFFVFVGTLQPRKNVGRILDAHRALPEFIQKSHPLIIIGRSGWQFADIFEKLNAQQATVRWLKYVPDSDLPSILRCASGLVFPSLYEGFGLPVLEAFAAELPVITSNSTSLPEVAGNAALLVDPYDVQNISWAMQQLIEDTVAADQLRLLGLKRAKEFTWDNTAQATVRAYQQTMFDF